MPRTLGTGGPVKGTITNDNAAAGYVGEFMEAKLVAASATSLTSNADKTITSISLTAGDWDVSGVVGFIPAATTSITRLAASISLTDNANAGTDDGASSQWGTAANVAVQANAIATPIRRVSIAATTTVYLVADAVFTVSTMTAFGHIRARRVR